MRTSEADNGGDNPSPPTSPRVPFPSRPHLSYLLSSSGGGE